MGILLYGVIASLIWGVPIAFLIRLVLARKLVAREFENLDLLLVVVSTIAAFAPVVAVVWEARTQAARAASTPLTVTAANLAKQTVTEIADARVTDFRFDPKPIFTRSRGALSGVYLRLIPLSGVEGRSLFFYKSILHESEVEPLLKLTTVRGCIRRDDAIFNAKVPHDALIVDADYGIGRLVLFSVLMALIAYLCNGTIAARIPELRWFQR